MSAKKGLFKTFSLIFTSLLAASVFSTAIAASESPVGYWKTVDDKSGQVLSVVHIYPANNQLEGKVVKIMPVEGQRSDDTCKKCRGPMQDKPILGMKIMWGMQEISPDTWGKGRVLDPKSGDVYQGTMKLTNGGNNLLMRGYVGVPMFGRTQTWTRTNSQ